MTETFTVKEIVQQIHDKQEKMDDKIDKIHSNVTRTNGKVSLHTKLIWGAYGFTSAAIIVTINILHRIT